MGVIVKALSNTKPEMGQNFIGAPSFRYKNPYFYDLYCDDRYASIFPSVKAIANEFMTIRPFTINNKKESVSSATRDALYHPNQLDSSVAFFEKLAVMNLTHRNTYLLVWRRDGNEAKPGGTLTPANIAGFTFLENPAIEIRDKRTYYKMGVQEFSDMEVITIPGGVDPTGLYRGYAPGIASSQWATLDDFIADYQKGFFKNGAIPSGLFTIVAATTTEYYDIVDKIQERHGGAGNNNKPTFAHAPIDKDGKPAQAQITWTPMQQSNKEIDFKNLFEQANKRIDSAFGVPASIRGVGENNNYATAKTDQQNFIRFTVKPLALRIYTQITHELNRITGGLGVAITFKLELPAIADEEKVVEETKQIRDNRVLRLIEQGYSLASIKEYLDSGDIESLEKSLEPTSEDDDVDDGDEVIDSPDPSEIDGITPIKTTNEATDYDKLYAVSKNIMKSQVDKAVEDLREEDIANKVEPEPTDADQDNFVTEMMIVIAAIIIAKGIIQYALGKDLIKDAGINTDTLTEFILSDTARGRYEGYLRKVGTGYMNDTAESIRGVLAKANADGLTLADTKNELRKILDVDEYRIKRLAETELNRSQAMGSIESMIQIQSQTGAAIEKGLQHTGADNPCEFCATLLDRWVKVDQIFVQEGEAVIGKDGGVYLNNFAPNEAYDIHPNGHCVPQYRVVKE